MNIEDIEIKVKAKAEELLSKMPNGNAKVICMQSYDSTDIDETKQFWKDVYNYINQSK